MRKLILITSLAAAIAAAAAPGLAAAQNACEAVKHDDKIVGTLLGAIGGAVLGDIVGGHGHKADGAIVGAAGGAIVGNQLARSKTPCPDGYARYGYEAERRVYLAPQPVYRTDYRPDYRLSSDDRFSGGYRANGDGRVDGYDRRNDDGHDDVRRVDRVGAYYDGAGRECRMVSRSYIAPDGDYVTRQERVCR